MNSFLFSIKKLINREPYKVLKILLNIIYYYTYTEMAIILYYDS